MKNLTLLIVMLIVLSACAKNDVRQVSLIEVFDGKDNEISDNWVIAKEGNNFYLAKKGIWQIMISKDPSKVVMGVYRLWEDGDRVKKGKLMEVK